MARERKRSKQRRQGRVRAGAPDTTDAVEAMEANVPGALGHTGDVDEFDAALVRGAQSAQSSDDAAELVGLPHEEGTDAFGDGAAADDESFAPLEPRVGRGGSAAGRPAAAQPSGHLGIRAIAFLQASWAELQRVQWPDRRQIGQATAVVLGFVVVAGLYLGVADWVASKLVNFVL